MLAQGAAGYMWRTARGKWVAVSEMATPHLVSALKGMERRNKRFTRQWYVLAAEAVKRGLGSDYRMQAPFSSC